MSLSNGDDDRKKRPPINYREFQEILETEHPEYTLIRDWNLSIGEISRLRGVRGSEEYKRKWEKIWKERRTDRRERER